MTPEQQEKLAALTERIADVFLEDADPAGWAGAGKPGSERSRDERGDRAWQIKAANQVGLLLSRSLELGLRTGKPDPANPVVPAYNPEEDIRRFEREAERVLERARSK